MERDHNTASLLGGDPKGGGAGKVRLARHMAQQESQGQRGIGTVKWAEPCKGSC